MLPIEVLNEMLEETRQRVFDISHRVTELTMELKMESKGKYSRSNAPAVLL